MPLPSQANVASRRFYDCSTALSDFEYRGLGGAYNYIKSKAKKVGTFVASQIDESINNESIFIDAPVELGFAWTKTDIEQAPQNFKFLGPKKHQRR